MIKSKTVPILICYSGCMLVAQGLQLPAGINPAMVKELMQQYGGKDASSGKSATSRGASTKNTSNTPAAAQPADLTTQSQQANLDAKADRELEELKAKDTGPRRFGQDLFTFRDHKDQDTAGGISEDYVLQTGDGLSVLLTGDQNDQQDMDVDGKGEVDLPSVGSIKVSGLDVSSAKRKIQAAVRRKFSQTDVSVKVTKLREVRVFILGEVYRPGSYVVPSLNSLINVLSLAGGPDSLGSYRAIRILRGGRTIQSVDLYAIRTEGKGNFNLTFQNGDTVFVPLAGTQVLLEGAFTRVVGLAEPAPADPFTNSDQWTRKRDQLQKQVLYLEKQINGTAFEVQEGVTGTGSSESQDAPVAEDAATPTLGARDHAKAMDQLETLQQKLEEFRSKERGDHRIRTADLDKKKYQSTDTDLQPWIQRWMDESIAPRLQFELLPKENAADAIEFAGGLLDYAYNRTLSLRHRDPSGVTSLTDLDLKDPASLAKIELHKGDVLSALPSREDYLKAVNIKGWARAVGRFARTEGLRVGELLKQQAQVMPDTFLGRAEIIRTKADGTQIYLSFDLGKALAGDPKEDLILEDRDQVELYRATDMIQSHTVTVSGPMTRAGDFAFYEGMRASDLLFRAGVPRRAANELTAELARFKNGRTSEVIPLDLPKILITEQQVPELLRVDAINPVLQPDDRISVFEKPDFHVHRVVTITGEIGKPGTYVIDREGMTLKALVERAGGLTADAMPRAALFLRNPQALDPSLKKAENASGVKTADPTALGINEILSRLAETKRQPISGELLIPPMLHALLPNHLNRLVIDFDAALKGDPDADVTMEDGDSIVIPHKTDSVYVVGETASPFSVYKAQKGLNVSKLLLLAGGTTRNADTRNIRLLKGNGRIIDRGVNGQDVEAGDVLLIPQKIDRDYNWQENLQALTPLALIYNAMKK